MNTKLGGPIKALSFILAMAFMANEFAFAAPDIASSELFAFHGKNGLMPDLPHATGVTEEVFKSSNPAHLYLIQDAHTNPSAQKNIAKTIDLLVRNKNVRWVFIEGGFGNDSLSGFRASDRTKRERLADSYLAKGELSGAEYLDLLSDKNFTLWGVEDRALYSRSLEVYSKIAKNRERYQEYLKKISQTVQTLKPHIFNPALQVFDKKCSDYREQRVSVTQRYTFLLAEAGKRNIPAEIYPHFLALGGLMEKERAIDFQKAGEEERAALRLFTDAELRDLQKTAPEKLSSKDPREARAFYALLEERTAAAGGREDAPELFKYFDYLKAWEAIDAKELLDEDKRLEKIIVNSLAVSQDEKELIRVEEMLRGLEGLFNLTLTPDEFEAYQSQSRGMDISYLTGYLNRKIMDLGSYYERALFLENNFNEFMRSAQEFYALTRQRDENFISKALQKMGEVGADKAVLITGGYHTPNLKSLLRSKNIGFVSITPQVLYPTNLKRYEKILLSQSFTDKQIAPVAVMDRSASTLFLNQATLSAELGPVTGFSGSRLAAVAGTSLLQMKQELAALRESHYLLGYDEAQATRKIDILRAGTDQNVPFLFTLDDLKHEHYLRNVRRAQKLISQIRRIEALNQVNASRWYAEALRFLKRDEKYAPWFGALSKYQTDLNIEVWRRHHQNLVMGYAYVIGSKRGLHSDDLRRLLLAAAFHDTKMNVFEKLKISPDVTDIVYPQGEPSDLAKILMVADTFDAITRKSPSQSEPKSIAEALEVLESESADGKKLDPLIVNQLVRVMEEAASGARLSERELGGSFKTIRNKIRDAFEEYLESYEASTVLAQRRFEDRDWTGGQKDAGQRLELYRNSLNNLEQFILEHSIKRLYGKAFWMKAKRYYTDFFASRYENDLAVTFFYSTMRRVLSRKHIPVEYTDDGVAASHNAAYARLLTSTFAHATPQALVEQVLTGRFNKPYEDLGRDARLGAEKIDQRLEEIFGQPVKIDSIEILNRTFYRNKGAYLVGRIFAEEKKIPIAFALLHPDEGIKLNAVQVGEDRVSKIFSYARSNFHVDITHYRELADYLNQLMPRRELADIYSFIGFENPAKIELIRELRKKLISKKFTRTTGKAGTVMEVFSLPTLPYVLKIIKDKSLKENYIGMSGVMEQYRSVNRIDRVGRLMNAMGFRDLAFHKSNFDETLLRELLESAPSSLIVDGDRVILKNVYVQRKVIPFDIFFNDPATSNEIKRKVIVDFGYCIKALTAAGIFPGDIFNTANFGVTRGGKVVLFDFDDLEKLVLMDGKIKSLIEDWPENVDDLAPNEDWAFYFDGYYVPEMLARVIPDELKPLFEKSHLDLLTKKYWNDIIADLKSGKIINFVPYDESDQLPNSPATTGARLSESRTHLLVPNDLLNRISIAPHRSWGWPEDSPENKPIAIKDMDRIIQEFFVKDDSKNTASLLKKLFANSVPAVEDIAKIYVKGFQRGLFLRVHKVTIVLKDGRSALFTLNIPTTYSKSNALAALDIKNLTYWHERSPDLVVEPIVSDAVTIRDHTGGEAVTVFALQWLGDYLELNPIRYKRKAAFFLNDAGREEDPVHGTGLENTAANNDAVVSEIARVMTLLCDYDPATGNASFPRQVRIPAGDFMLRVKEGGDFDLKLITIRANAFNTTSDDFMDVLLGGRFIPIGSVNGFNASAVLKGVAQGLFAKYGSPQAAVIYRQWLDSFEKILDMQIKEYGRILVDNNILLGEGKSLDSKFLKWLEIRLTSPEEYFPTRFTEKEKSTLLSILYTNHSVMPQLLALINGEKKHAEVIKTSLDNARKEDFAAWASQPNRVSTYHNQSDYDKLIRWMDVFKKGIDEYIPQLTLILKKVSEFSEPNNIFSEARYLEREYREFAVQFYESIQELIGQLKSFSGQQAPPSAGFRYNITEIRIRMEAMYQKLEGDRTGFSQIPIIVYDNEKIIDIFKKMVSIIRQIESLTAFVPATDSGARLAEQKGPRVLTLDKIQPILHFHMEPSMSIDIVFPRHIEVLQRDPRGHFVAIPELPKKGGRLNFLLPGPFDLTSASAIDIWDIAHGKNGWVYQCRLCYPKDVNGREYYVRLRLNNETGAVSIELMKPSESITVWLRTLFDTDPEWSTEDTLVDDSDMDSSPIAPLNDEEIIHHVHNLEEGAKHRVWPMTSVDLIMLGRLAMTVAVDPELDVRLLKSIFQIVSNRRDPQIVATVTMGWLKSKRPQFNSLLSVLKSVMSPAARQRIWLGRQPDYEKAPSAQHGTRGPPPSYNAQIRMRTVYGQQEPSRVKQYVQHADAIRANFIQNSLDKHIKDHAGQSATVRSIVVVGSFLYGKKAPTNLNLYAIVDGVPNEFVPLKQHYKISLSFFRREHARFTDMANVTFLTESQLFQSPKTATLLANAGVFLRASGLRDIDLAAYRASNPNRLIWTSNALLDAIKMTELQKDRTERFDDAISVWRRKAMRRINEGNLFLRMVDPAIALPQQVIDAATRNLHAFMKGVFPDKTLRPLFLKIIGRLQNAVFLGWVSWAAKIIQADIENREVPPTHKHDTPDSGARLAILNGFEVTGTTFIPDLRTNQLIKINVVPFLKSGDKVLDVGTGSGNITKIMAEETIGRGVLFTAVDINSDAVNDSRINLGNFLNVRIFRSDLYTDISHDRFDVIISNPAWFSSQLDKHTGTPHNSATVDPNYQTLNRLFSGAPTHLSPGGSIYLIFPAARGEQLSQIAGTHGFSLVQRNRIGGMALYEATIASQISRQKTRLHTIQDSGARLAQMTDQRYSRLPARKEHQVIATGDINNLGLGSLFSLMRDVVLHLDGNNEVFTLFQTAPLESRRILLANLKRPASSVRGISGRRRPLEELLALEADKEKAIILMKKILSITTTLSETKISFRKKLRDQRRYYQQKAFEQGERSRGPYDHHDMNLPGPETLYPSETPGIIWIARMLIELGNLEKLLPNKSGSWLGYAKSKIKGLFARQEFKIFYESPDFFQVVEKEVNPYLFVPQETLEMAYYLRFGYLQEDHHSVDFDDEDAWQDHTKPERGGDPEVLRKAKEAKTYYEALFQKRLDHKISPEENKLFSALFYVENHVSLQKLKRALDLQIQLKQEGKWETLNAQYGRLMERFKDFWNPKKNAFIRQFPDGFMNGPVGRLDYFSRIALFSLEKNSRFATAEGVPVAEIELESYTNPLLMASGRRRKETRVEPLSIHLTGENNALLLSGPNMGGKTTTARSIGLAVLLNQMGWPIPAPKSSLGVFRRIFTVFPEPEQLHEGYGYFGGLVQQLTVLTQTAKKGDLIILDEVPTGTDYYELVALTSILLEDLIRSGATVIATGHLKKTFEIVAEQTGIQPMQHSVKVGDGQVEPDFKLVPGIAQHSYAIELMAKANFPEDVIKDARNYYRSIMEGSGGHAGARLASDEDRLYRLLSMMLGEGQDSSRGEEGIAPNAMNMAQKVFGNLYPQEYFTFEKTREKVLKSFKDNSLKPEEIEERHRKTLLFVSFGRKKLEELQQLIKKFESYNDRLGMFMQRNFNWAENEKKITALSKFLDKVISQLDALGGDEFIVELKNRLIASKEDLGRLRRHFGNVDTTSFQKNDWEALAAEWANQWGQVLSDIFSTASEIDEWSGRANVVIANHLKQPKFLDDPHVFKLAESAPFFPNESDIFMRSPSAFLAGGVAQSLDIDPKKPIAVLTAPNSSGKTVTMFNCFMNTLLALNGHFVSGDFELSRFDQVFSFFGSQDKVDQGQSYFMAILNHYAAILLNASPNSLVILDEMHGSDNFELAAIQLAVLHHLKKIGATVIFNTHIRDGLKEASESIGLDLWTSQVVFDAGTHTVKPKFKLERDPNLEAKSYGLAIARQWLTPDQFRRAMDLYAKLTGGARLAGEHMMSRRNFLKGVTAGILFLPALLSADDRKRIERSPLPFPDKPVTDLEPGPERLIQRMQKVVDQFYAQYLVAGSDGKLRLREGITREAYSGAYLINVVTLIDQSLTDVEADMLREGLIGPLEKERIRALENPREAATQSLDLLTRYFARHGYFLTVDENYSSAENLPVPYFDLRRIRLITEETQSVYAGKNAKKEVNFKAYWLEPSVVKTPNRYFSGLLDNQPGAVTYGHAQVLIREDSLESRVNNAVTNYRKLAAAPVGKDARPAVDAMHTLYRAYYREQRLSLKMTDAELSRHFRKIFIEWNMLDEASHIFEGSGATPVARNQDEGLLFELRSSANPPLLAPYLIQYITADYLNSAVSEEQGMHPNAYHGKDMLFIRSRLAFHFWKDEEMQNRYGLHFNRYKKDEVAQFCALPSNLRREIMWEMGRLSEQDLVRLYEKMWDEIQGDDSPFLKGLDVKPLPDLMAIERPSWWSANWKGLAAAGGFTAAVAAYEIWRRSQEKTPPTTDSGSRLAHQNVTRLIEKEKETDMPGAAAKVLKAWIAGERPQRKIFELIMSIEHDASKPFLIHKAAMAVRLSPDEYNTTDFDSHVDLINLFSLKRERLSTVIIVFDPESGNPQNIIVSQHTPQAHQTYEFLDAMLIQAGFSRAVIDKTGAYVDPKWFGFSPGKNTFGQNLRLFRAQYSQTSSNAGARLAASPPFRILDDPERSITVTNNRKYLEAKGWLEAIEGFDYEPLYFLEDPDMPRYMDVIERQTKQSLAIIKNFLEPMIVSPRDTPEVTPEEVSEHVRARLRSFVHFYQSIYYLASNDAGRAAQAYQKALEESEKEYLVINQLEEKRTKDTITAIENVGHEEIKNLALPAYLDTIERLRRRKKEENIQRSGFVGTFIKGNFSDDLFQIAHEVFMRRREDIPKAEFLFAQGLSLYDPLKPNRHLAKDFAENLAFLRLVRDPHYRGIDLLRPIIEAKHSSFNAWSQAMILTDTLLSKGLRSHFERVKKETLEASSRVNENGVAVVLGAGAFVIFPLADLLKEKLPDGSLKYKKIILVEIAPDISKRALEELISSGQITKEEAARTEIFPIDATHLLRNLTSKIDGIFENAISQSNTANEPLQFPRDEIADLLAELRNPEKIQNYESPVDERAIGSGSIKLVVLGVALQDFVSPIKDYIDIWAQLFRLEPEDSEVLELWDKSHDQIEQNVASVVIRDMSRILSAEGIAFIAEPIGIQLADKGETREVLFQGKEGIRSLVPQSVPMQPVNSVRWFRPLNDQRSGEPEKNFIIEGLTLQNKGARLAVVDKEKPIYVYKTLLGALKSGIQLIAVDEHSRFSSKWGEIDLGKLNDIRNYAGREGLFKLARDLELATKKHYLKFNTNGRMNPKKNKINIQKLRPLVKIKELGLTAQYLQWQKYFDVQQELTRHSGAYQKNEGLIKLARNMKINSVQHLYYAFGGRENSYKWTEIGLTLKDIDRVQEELAFHPNDYQNDEGQIKLARKMNINTIQHLYSVFGGDGNRYRWTQISLTLEDLDLVQKELAHNPDDYKGPEAYKLIALTLHFPAYKTEELYRLWPIITGARLADSGGESRRDFLRRGKVALLFTGLKPASILQLLALEPGSIAYVRGLKSALTSNAQGMLKHLIFKEHSNYVFNRLHENSAKNAGKYFLSTLIMPKEAVLQVPSMPLVETQALLGETFENKINDRSQEWIDYFESFDRSLHSNEEEREQMARLGYVSDALYDAIEQSDFGKEVLQRADLENQGMVRFVQSLSDSEVESLDRKFRSERDFMIKRMKLDDFFRSYDEHLPDEMTARKYTLYLRVNMKKQVEAKIQSLKGTDNDLEIKKLRKELEKLERGIKALSEEGRARAPQFEELSEAAFQKNLKIFALKLWRLYPQSDGQGFALAVNEKLGVDKKFAAQLSYHYDKEKDELTLSLEGQGTPLITIENAKKAPVEVTEQGSENKLTQADLFTLTQISSIDTKPRFAALNLNQAIQIDVPLTHFNVFDETQRDPQIRFAKARAEAIHKANPKIQFVFSGEGEEVKNSILTVRLGSPLESLSQVTGRVNFIINGLKPGVWPDWDGAFYAASGVGGVVVNKTDIQEISENDFTPDFMNYLKRHAKEPEGNFGQLLIKMLKGETITPAELEKIAFWLPLAEEVNWQTIFQGARLAEKTLASSA